VVTCDQDETLYGAGKGKKLGDVNGKKKKRSHANPCGDGFDAKHITQGGRQAINEKTRAKLPQDPWVLEGSCNTLGKQRKSGKTDKNVMLVCRHKGTWGGVAQKKGGHRKKACFVLKAQS